MKPSKCFALSKVTPKFLVPTSDHPQKFPKSERETLKSTEVGNLNKLVILLLSENIDAIASGFIKDQQEAFTTAATDD